MCAWRSIQNLATPQGHAPRRTLWLAVCLLAALLGPGVEASAAGVAINEIFYHPPEERDELQFVELHNASAAAADLSGWSLAGGIGFTFSKGISMPPGGYLVVCRNRKAFQAHYGGQIPALGDFKGRLKHSGEKVGLLDAAGRTVESLEYGDAPPWPKGPDGFSSSLERISPKAPATLPANWTGSVLPAYDRAAGTPGRKNDMFSERLPPIVSSVEFRPPRANTPCPVSVRIEDAGGVRSVALLVTTIREQAVSPETESALERVAGDARQGTYRGIIPAQPENTLVRFRIKAINESGTERFEPALNEPRPTFTYGTFLNTNRARIAFVSLLDPSRTLPGRAPPRGRSGGSADRARGQAVFLYAAPESPEVQVFDHVELRSRASGLKVHFQSDRPFRGMTALNLIVEGPARQALSEYLSFELYRMAGVPSPQAEHVRVWRDGRLAGYQLLVEQPNKAFLARHGRDTSGNLYKLIWQGRDLVGQHEKKTNPAQGHDDLKEAVEALRQTRGDVQWARIQQRFNVEEFLNYFAVSMCVQNWDGFWNNYFVYHDLKGSGRWEIYPWDEDKTWGDYDGVGEAFDWYEMPLSFGMDRDRPPRFSFLGQRQRHTGEFGGANWWRRPGWFSGPLLANPEFRRRFLDRLEQMAQTTFTEERLLPVIDALEKRLEPEIEVRARAIRQDPEGAIRRFHHHIQTLRNQVKHRRDYILEHLPAERRALAGGRRWLWLGLGAGPLALLLAALLIWRRRRSQRPPPLPPRIPPLLPPRPLDAPPLLPRS